MLQKYGHQNHALETFRLTGNRKKKKGLIDQDTVSKHPTKATGGRMSPISDKLKCGTIHGDTTEKKKKNNFEKQARGRKQGILILRDLFWKHQYGAHRFSNFLRCLLNKTAT